LVFQVQVPVFLNVHDLVKLSLKLKSVPSGTVSLTNSAWLQARAVAAVGGSAAPNVAVGMTG
jgi:hypothetical protein